MGATGAAPLPAYATAEDLRDRWPELEPGDEPLAEALLADASAMLDSMSPFGGEPEGGWDGRQLAALRAVACEIVRASMESRGEAYGSSQLTLTAGPYSQTTTYPSAAGALYVTKAQRRRLGIGIPAAGFASPWGPA